MCIIKYNKLGEYVQNISIDVTFKGVPSLLIVGLLKHKSFKKIAISDPKVDWKNALGIKPAGVQVYCIKFLNKQIIISNKISSIRLLR